MGNLTSEQLWIEISKLEWSRNKPLKKVIVASFDEFKHLTKEKPISDIIKELAKAEQFWGYRSDEINSKNQDDRDVLHKQMLGEYNWGFTKIRHTPIDPLSEIGKIYFKKKYNMNIEERELNLQKARKREETMAKKKAESDARNLEYYSRLKKL